MEQNFTFAFPNSLFNPKDFQCVIKPSIDFLKHLSGLDFRLLQNQIENAKFAYDQDNKQILTDEYFTIFYYCYDFINKKMNSGESKQQISWIIDNTIDFLCTKIQILGSQESIDQDVLKVLLLFICQYLQSCCIKNSKNIMEQDQKRNKVSEFQTKIMNYCKKCLNILKSMLQVQIDDMNKYKLIGETTFKLLESKVMLKKDDIKDIIFEIIVQCLQKDNNQHILIQHKIVNLIYQDEDIIRTLIELVQYVHDNINHNSLVLNVIQLLTDYAINNKFNVESQSIKNIFKFFSKLSELIPKIFNSNIQQFMSFYESDNYYLRNTLTQIIAHIIIKLLNPQLHQDRDEDFKQQNHQQKYNLILKLQTRIYDKNAYSRSFTLQVLQELVSNNVIPPELIFDMLKDVAGRLRDQSSFVRKQALILYKKILKFYKQLFVDLFKYDRFLTLEEIEFQIEFQQKCIDSNQAIFDELQSSKVDCDDEKDFDNFVVQEIEIKKKIKESKQVINILQIYKQVNQSNHYYYQGIIINSNQSSLILLVIVQQNNYGCQRCLIFSILSLQNQDLQFKLISEKVIASCLAS